MNTSKLQQLKEHPVSTGALPGWLTASPTTPRDYEPKRQLAPGLEVSSFEGAKIVIKPWGHETWLHDLAAPYAYKLFIVRKGHRTSLMSHRAKRETYFILSGTGRLHYCLDNRYTKGDPTETIEFGPGTVVQIEPGALHRAEATTEDCVILEATTPDPDGTDVIRHDDDEGRCDGRVGGEHAESIHT
jgi:mannose-6-phosphate isomerase-like protein (cupin superfamily)